MCAALKILLQWIKRPEEIHLVWQYVCHVWGVNINVVLEKATRKRKMQKPDKLLRKYSLEKVIPAGATMRKVLLMNSDPIWPNVERRFCICRGLQNTHMLGCEGCNEWYHGGCLALKGAAFKAAANDKDWRCGFCLDNVDGDGEIQHWRADVSASLTKSKRAKLERSVDDTPLARGVELDDPWEEAQVVPSWDELVVEVQKGAKKIRQEEKARKGKAVRALKRGGHHIVDERVRGGVKKRMVNGALIDELAEAGMLSEGEGDDAGVSEPSDDE